MTATMMPKEMLDNLNVSEHRGLARIIALICGSRSPSLWLRSWLPSRTPTDLMLLEKSLNLALGLLPKFDGNGAMVQCSRQMPVSLHLP